MLTIIALCSLGGLVAVWVVYPLTIGALAAIARRVRKHSTWYARADDDPHVSIILATRADAEATSQRVFDCLRTEYDPARLEVIVGVDSRAQNAALRDLSFRASNVRVVPGDSVGGKAAALNAAVRAATGDVLVFTDVYQRFQADAVRALVRRLRAPRVGAVSGCLHIPATSARRSLAERYWHFERWLRSREAIVHSCVGVTGAIWAMRRSLWTPLPANLINDDLYAPMQIVLRGSRVAFAWDARAFEMRRHEPRQEYARKVRTLTGVVQLCTWVPAVLNPLRDPIWIQFVFHKLLRLLTPYWVAAVALWATLATAQLLSAHLSAAGALLVAAAILLLLYARSRVVAVIRETLVSGALLQVATIVGTVKGVRRRWNVWQ